MRIFMGIVLRTRGSRSLFVRQQSPVGRAVSPRSPVVLRGRNTRHRINIVRGIEYWLEIGSHFINIFVFDIVAIKIHFI